MKKIFEAIMNFLKNFFGVKDNDPAETDSTTVVTTDNVTTDSPEEFPDEDEMKPEDNDDSDMIAENEEPQEKYNEDMVILLDNGHASTTPGKRSPVFDDGYQFREYEFNRDIVKRISKRLDKLGIKYRIITPEVDEDIKLTVRAARVNKYCSEFGTKNCLMISVHANAGGHGEWQSGRGWSIYTSKGQTKSDEYATIFFEEAQKLLPKYGMTLRKNMTDNDPDYEENFTIIYNTKCPAVLTENLFMDNKIDVEFIRSDEGRNVITEIHVNAIKRICRVA